ncbi:RHH_1 domain-containing protein [Nitrospira tepida]|uniref:RHH_1 domain-containing protein n=1 Tax=Nitrospira tepida TaxID=2973512 RepID=A0AA86T8A7_9BACT|nr:RHH_1 domain-containing protein [Nitrospira tepida]
MIERLARTRGRTKSEVVREAIGVLAKQTEGRDKADRPYETIRDLIGIVRGGPPDLSIQTGKAFRRLVAVKRQGA